jgi:Mg-chelatase subunit ChlD
MTYIKYPSDLTYVSSVPTYLQTLQPVAAVQKVDLVSAFEPKRAGKNPKLSHIVFVLDESSSMSSCWDSTISGYNEYLAAQRADAERTGIETLVSLYKFNGSQVNCVFDRVDVKSVKPIDKTSYRPSGGTNLNDAFAGAMMQVNKLLSAKHKSDRESVIITVLTDGEENSSRTFSSSDVKGMVEKAEGKSWGFMFLGANINAFHAGSALGFNMNNTMQFNAKNVGETINAASAMTSRMRSAYASGLSTDATYAATAFTDAERSASVGKKDE